MIEIFEGGLLAIFKSDMKKGLGIRKMRKKMEDYPAKSISFESFKTSKTSHFYATP